MASNQEHNCDSQVISKIGENLYLKQCKADVCFHFKTTEERIPAHKILLSSASDVFEAMFYGPLKEENEIEIVEVTAEAFKEFLQFFYFNNVKLSIEHISEVMYLGRKYDVEGSLQMCARFLATKITTENVITALELAIEYQQEELRASCESEISSHSSEVLRLPEFLKCDHRVLDHILNIDRLSCSENEVFDACMTWTRNASKQDQLTKDVILTHLGDLFYKIRFVSMSMDEFVKLLPMYGGLFSAAEYNEILQLISKQETEPKLFTCRPRMPNQNKLIFDGSSVIRCDRRVHGASKRFLIAIKSTDITTFSTNRTVLLGYFDCVELLDANGHLYNRKNVSATISANFSEIQAQFLFDYVSNGDGAAVKVPNPVLMKPGIVYQIQLKFPSMDNLQARANLKTECDLGRGHVVKFHNDNETLTASTKAIAQLRFNIHN